MRILDEQPGNVDPLYAFWFDASEWDDAKQKFQQVMHFEQYLVDEHQIKIPDVFNKFYNDTRDEVGFFSLLATYLSDAGFYVYDSDTYFEVYDAETVEGEYSSFDLEHMGATFKFYTVYIRPEIYRRAVVKAHSSDDARAKAYDLSVVAFLPPVTVLGTEGFTIMEVEELK